jgi:stress up-regulated protein Nod 19
MDPIGTQIARRLNGFCTNCTVLYTKAELMFENGTLATVEHGVYEHHVVVVDLAKRVMPFYLCNGQQGFLGQFPAVGFVVSGNDEAPNMFTTPDGTFNSGYLIGPQQMLAMQAELVNYRTEEQKVYVTVDYEYVQTPAETPADSVVALFSVTGCGFPDYHRPASQKVYNVTSDTISVPTDGFIINAKGHLHDGGDHIILELNGQQICNSHAIYGPMKEAQGQKWAVIEKMEQCTKPVAVKKGDKLRMVSFYDAEKHPPRPTQGSDGHAHNDGEADEMGVFFLNFASTTKTAAKLRIPAAA